LKKTVFFLLLLLFVSVVTVAVHIPVVYANPSIEDFLNDYVEVDDNNHITVTVSKCEAVGLTRSEGAYVYRDKGVNHFDGDFEHYLTIKTVSGADDLGYLVHWILANDVGTWNDLATRLCIYSVGGSTKGDVYLRFKDATHDDYEKFVGSKNTVYYLIVKRSGIGADNVELKIYSDPERTNLLSTLTITEENVDYRYVYGMSSIGIATTSGVDGYTENLELIPNTVTFRFNDGGQFRIDNATITNGTQITYAYNSTIELCAVTKNQSWVFVSFNWSSSSVTNPHNLTIIQNETVWLYFRDPPAWKLGEETNIPVLFVGACVIAGLIAFVFVLTRKKKG